jgi:hypothetical protein
MKASLLSIVMIFGFVSPMMAETQDGSAHSVRLDQRGASSSVPPANTAKGDTPFLSNGKLSAQGAGVVAVGWAGGLSTHPNCGTTNSMSKIGGSTPGGFYNASNVRIVSVQFHKGPVPYYLVRMTGQIGNTRQTLYAAVLEDGRIITPTLVSGASQAKRSTHRKAQ